MFDLSVYYPLPLLTTEGYVSLANTMLDVKPLNGPEQVAIAALSLQEVLKEAEQGLVTRIDEDLSTKRERAFDGFVDGVWFELRQRLEFYSAYHHEGVAMFTKEDREYLEIDDRLARARIAADMLERLFGAGTDFLRAPFPQQASHMAARLDWIESKELGEMLEKLVDPYLAKLILRCQVRYEAMVSDRSSRYGKSLADLNELRNNLRRQLYSYIGAIGTMYDYKEPESAKPVEAALRPILVTRARVRRKLSSADKSDLELEAELVEADAVANEDEPAIDIPDFDPGES